MHGLAIGIVAAFHLIGPDGAGVIDQHVDRAGRYRLMRDRRTQPVAVFDREALRLEPLPDQAGEDVLLGKALRPDDDAVVAPVAELDGKRTKNAQQDRRQPAD